MKSWEAYERLIFQYTYEDLQDMIYMLVHNYIEKYGGDFQTVLSTAHLYFLVAMNTWDPQKGALTTHVYHKVRGGLLQVRRKDMRSHTRMVQSKGIKTMLTVRPLSGFEKHVIEQVTTCSTNVAFLCDLLDELSDDARTLIHTLLDDDEQLQRRIHEKSAYPRAIKRAVTEHLNDLLNWNAYRVDKSWREVQGAFS